MKLNKSWLILGGFWFLMLFIFGIQFVVEKNGGDFKIGVQSNDEYLALKQLEAARSYGDFQGFNRVVVAEGLFNPQAMVFGSDGYLYVAEKETGNVIVLSDQSSEGYFNKSQVYAKDLKNPGGIAFYNDRVYIGVDDEILELEDADNDYNVDTYRVLYQGDFESRHLDINSHGKLYASQKSMIDFERDGDVLTTGMVIGYNILVDDANLFSAGFSNPMGIVLHPFTGDILSIDQTQKLKNSVSYEEVNLLAPEFSYGWPGCSGKDLKNKCPQSVPAILELPSGLGLSGMTFYTGTNFPPDYANNLFIAMNPKKGSEFVPGILKVQMIYNSGSFSVEDIGLFSNTYFNPIDVKEGPDGNLYVLDQGDGKIYMISPVFF